MLNADWRLKMRNKKYNLAATFVILLLFTASCQPASSTSTETASKRQQLTIMTHDSFAASESVIQSFENENNVDLVFLQSGDTGAALNRAILSKENPLADVFYGVRFFRYIECIMPLNAEGRLIYGFFVCQIMKLLKD